jgi:hypothetical protein
MKRKIILCLSLLLTACTPLIPAPTPIDPKTATETYLSQLSDANAAEALAAFDFSSKCPNVCWLGIQPGVTATKEALGKLKSSSQNNLFNQTETEIHTIWYKGARRFESNVYLTLNNGSVRSISIDSMFVVKMSHIFKLLGEPNNIDILLVHPPDNVPYVQYSIYYKQQKITVVVTDGEWDGPNQNDKIEGIILGEDFKGGRIQPWRGYGHLQDYLPGETVPTGPYPTPSSP